MPLDPGHDEAADRAVDRFWDHVALNQSDPAGGLDPADAATIRHLHAVDDRPVPSPTFVRRLREDLMHAHALPVSSSPSPALLPNGRPAPSPAAGQPRVPRSIERHQWGVAHLATAALLLVTLGLGFLALVPRRSDPPRTIPGGFVQSAPPAAGGFTEETLLEITLPEDALPRGEDVYAGLSFVSVPPGSRETWEPNCCPGPLLEHVLSGVYTVRAEAAIRVFRVDGTAEEVPAGTEIVLGPGDSLLSRIETVVEAANAGDTPLELLHWVLIDDPDLDYHSHRYRLSDWIWLDLDDRSSVDVPPGSARLRLRQVELAPQSTFPAPQSAGTQLGVTPFKIVNGTPEADQNVPIYRSDSISNFGPRPFTIYIVTLEPDGTDATIPAAATPAP